MIHELQRRAAGRSVKKIGRGRGFRKPERGRGQIPTRMKPRLGRSGVGSCENGTRGEDLEEWRRTEEDLLANEIFA